MGNVPTFGWDNSTPFCSTFPDHRKHLKFFPGYSGASWLHLLNQSHRSGCIIFAKHVGLSTLGLSAQTASQPRGLNKFILPVPETGSPRSRSQPIRCLVLAFLLLVGGRLLAVCSRGREGGRGDRERDHVSPPEANPQDTGSTRGPHLTLIASIKARLQIESLWGLALPDLHGVAWGTRTLSIAQTVKVSTSTPYAGFALPSSDSQQCGQTLVPLKPQRVCCERNRCLEKIGFCSETGLARGAHPTWNPKACQSELAACTGTPAPSLREPSDGRVNTGYSGSDTTWPLALPSSATESSHAIPKVSQSPAGRPTFASRQTSPEGSLPGQPQRPPPLR